MLRKSFKFIFLELFLAQILIRICITGSQTMQQEPAKYLTVPTHEVFQHTSHLAVTEYDELVVTFSGKGSDIRPNDFLTHADGIRVLTGGLKSFLDSGEREVIVPIVDDDDLKFGGGRLVGFVMLQVVTPRKLSYRRGDILYDLEEGGPEPELTVGNLIIGKSGVQMMDSSDYVPTPIGGGACITGRDCFHFNGTCAGSKGCKCLPDQQGSYCQLYRPQGVGGIQAKSKKKEFKYDPNRDNSQNKQNNKQEIKIDLPKPPPNVDTLVRIGRNYNGDTTTTTQQHQYRQQKTGSHVKKGPRKRKPIPKESKTEDSKPIESINKQQQERQHREALHREALHRMNERPRSSTIQPEIGVNQQEAILPPQTSTSNSNKDNVAGSTAKATIISPTSTTTSTSTSSAASNANTREEEDRRKRLQLEHQRQQQQQQQHSSTTQQHNANTATANSATKPPLQGESQSQQAQQTSVRSINDLYGINKAYPEPYPAGRVPGTLVQERRKQRTEGKSFIYAIRYRSGPLGLTFDNKPLDSTIIEKVERQGQSELSDVQVGDILIAIDQYNMTGAPAKASQRIMPNLPWPRILVFETRVLKLTDSQIQSKRELLTYNLTILYPPSLLGTYEIRAADWAPSFTLLTSFTSSSTEECPLYLLRAPQDEFGCTVNDTEYGIPTNVSLILGQRGYVDINLEQQYPMIALLVQEAYKRDILFKLKTLSIVRRGQCTFVDKLRIISNYNSHIGILVNNENTQLLDIPSGKENIENCTAPYASISERNGQLIHIAAMKQEVLGMITSTTNNYGLSTNCVRMRTMSEDILNKWAHSNPHTLISDILSMPPPSMKLRGPTDEGGRLAVSGENGWSYFDYHLAMFGEQDVPQIPLKIILANPIFGCDPNNYLVRISGSIVVILRGGGCSFGIKVLNAQKLGAKAVVILNTDDKKTMRLMAQPDEIPLINITCIMVSRRLQYYLEKQLTSYYLTDQHIGLIQPTGVFGDYELTNSVELPMRLPNR